MKRVHKPTERGAALVELAMILPLLALVFLVVIDLGLILREHQILQNAAREGARFSSLQKNEIAPTNPTANENTIKQRVIEYLAQENISVIAGDITVDQEHPITVGVFTLTGSEITVTYNRSLLIPGAPLLPFSQLTLTGQSVFRNLY